MPFKQCVSNLKTQHTLALALALFPALAIFACGAQAMSPSQVFNKVKDSVVVVKAFDTKGKIISQGSGVLLPSGKVGTNCHVVKNGIRFQVGSSKQFVSATLWGSDEEKDICLLEANGVTAKPAQLGQARRLRVGDPVYAVGAPKGLELSLSDGIVSQLRGGPPPFIQTTTAISPGSSGGGLFDAEARLVGFTTFYIEGAQSINFAIPVEWAGEIEVGTKVAQGRSEGEWLKRAIVYESTENFIGLRDWCQQWTQAQPQNSAAWFALGAANFKLDRYAESINAIRESLRLNPENASAWYMIAVTYVSLRRYSEAIEAFRQSLAIDRQDARVWRGLGLSYNFLKRNTDAIEAFREVLRINAKDASAWSHIGYNYAELQRYDDAIEAFRESLRVNSQDAMTWSGLALSYAATGNRSAALDAVQHLRPLDPAEADKVFNLIVPR